MKLVLLLSAAYIAVGFVIPGQSSLDPFIGYSASIPSPVSDDSGAEGGIAFSTSYTEEIFNNIEIASTLALYQPQSGRLSKPEKNAVDEFSHDYLDANSPNFCGHHGDPEKTTYQLINSTKRTKLFAKLVSQFDDIVDLLNSTKENHTVLVPRDKALQKAMNHHPPKEYVKKFVQYHILKEPKTAREIFHSRTIRTLLEQSELGDHDQRISTQFGVGGLTLNYISHIVKPDLCAKNGLVQILDHILLPPFQSSDTLSLVPSVFSALDFGLWKTGLYEKLNDTSSHTGGTFFAPTNIAFRKLGPRVNAFLFSRWGEKHLKALLEYHIVFGHTLYSDAYHQPKKDEDSKTIHVDLPTLLENHRLSIDIARFYRFATMKINGFISVASSDIIARDGVIHVLNDVLIPPKHPNHDRYPYIPRPGEDDDSPVPTVEDIIERFNPYIRED
ncbi:hypothetical protein DIZ76_012678 [Coccidioides immitis]|nr:hypothetical protein DIZ76_012678 [Coccidioides immitis]